MKVSTKFIYLFVYLFIYSFIYLFIYLFMYYRTCFEQSVLDIQVTIDCRFTL